MTEQIFIAGALFTPAQRSYLERIDELCTDCGFETYLPHRDVGLFEREDTPPSVFFNKDIEEIDQSDLIIAVINGLEVDAGTCVEIGYAYATDTDIVGVIDDTRIFDPEKQLNPMISGSVSEIVESFQDLESLLKDEYVN